MKKKKGWLDYAILFESKYRIMHEDGVTASNSYFPLVVQMYSKNGIKIDLNIVGFDVKIAAISKLKIYSTFLCKTIRFYLTGDNDKF